MEKWTVNGRKWTVNVQNRTVKCPKWKVNEKDPSKKVIQLEFREGVRYKKSLILDEGRKVSLIQSCD
ncbi:hypothetical protein [Neobacillus novalis]|uniref:hypothetical protein n=1 Tax=Neobacillus novalis TaxID=220687 RepID=UPI000824FC3E|nr:hypothetical protein [Neobacillus novalis]